MAQQLKVGMIGTGNVGTALTQGLTRAGHEVRGVGREPGKVAEVARWAEVVVLAVPFQERENAIREMGEGVRGKVLVDVTNALTPSYDFALDLKTSGAEQVQAWAPGAKVVKAFNTVFAQNMATGQLHGERLTVFAAGDDEGARRRVLQLAQEVGFDAVDAGGLAHATWLETLGFLNITLAYKVDLGPAIGFRLVHAGNVAASPAGQRQAEASRGEAGQRRR